VYKALGSISSTAEKEGRKKKTPPRRSSENRNVELWRGGALGLSEQRRG
jgi:hypothetical protein